MTYFQTSNEHCQSTDKLLNTDGLEDGNHQNAHPLPSSSSFRRSPRRRMAMAVGAVVTVALLLLTLTPAHVRRHRKQQGHDATAAWTYNTPPRVALPHVYDGAYTRNPINSTLGFQKILVLNLPHRKDKHDELLMLAEVSGLELTFVSTKLTEDLKPTELPYHAKMAHQKGAVGVARAHADAWVRMLEEGWQSALILEDDSDWDVDWRYAFQQLQQPFAQLLNSVDDGSGRAATRGPLTPTPNDPWMTSEWDVFNFGPCLESPFGSKFGPQYRTPLVPDVNKPPLVMYDDKTMPFHDPEHEGTTFPDMYDHYNQSDSYPKHDAIATTTTPRRMVALAHVPVCMNAYALTRAGANRFLYHSTRDLYAPIDNIMADLTSSDNLRGYDVVPPLLSQWKVKDNHAISSDNHIADAAGKSPEELAQYQAQIDQALLDQSLNHNPSVGWSAFIKNSMRKAMPDILNDRSRPWPL